MQYIKLCCKASIFILPEKYTKGSIFFKLVCDAYVRAENAEFFQQGKLSSPNERMYIIFLPHQVSSFPICSKKYNLQWTINYNYIFEKLDCL